MGVTEREWKHSTAEGYELEARRICWVIGDRPMEELTEDDLRALLSDLEPMRNGEAEARAIPADDDEVHDDHPRRLWARARARLARGGSVTAA